MLPYEITSEELSTLNAVQLQRLVKKLLSAELEKLKLKQASLIMSTNINDPDGGLDGLIAQDIPEGHSWLPPGKSGWQCTVEREFSATDAKNKVLNPNKD